MSFPTLRVLLVEGEPAEAGRVARSLRMPPPRGFEVIAAASLAEARSRLREGAPDAILAALSLPDSAGLQVVHELAAHAPLVVAVEPGAESSGEEAVAAGALDYVVRGEAGSGPLARTLRNAIERHALAARLRAASEGLERGVVERTAALQDRLAEERLSREALLSMMEDAELSARELARSENRLRGLVERLPDILYRYSPSRGGLYYSEQVAAVFGHPREHLYAHPRLWAESIHPEDRQRVDDAAIALRDHGRPYDLEYRIRDAAGEWRWLHDRSIGVARDDDDFVVEGLASDVTGRRRDQEAIRGAEEQFRGLVEQTLAGIYILQDGRFAYANPRLAEILGLADAGQLVGLDPLDFVAPGDRERVKREFGERLAEGARSAASTFRANRPDGALVEVGVHGARALHRGRPAVIGLVQDVTEKSRAEQLIQRYVKQLETSFMHAVEVATNLSELRDPYTAGHERRVAAIAVAIGEELGLDARRREGLRVAGYLHDVGKISVPSEILAKPGRLTPIELRLAQGHAQAGYDVLKGVDFPWPVAQVALQHHERIDGSGYPEGLVGDAILFEARIVAVADVVEAMSSHRPYRAGLGIDKALAEIEAGAGLRYDRAVADACLRLFREKGFTAGA
jgi:PAS domain S-box-containing protein